MPMPSDHHTDTLELSWEMSTKVPDNGNSPQIGHMEPCCPIQQASKTATPCRRSCDGAHAATDCARRCAEVAHSTADCAKKSAANVRSPALETLTEKVLTFRHGGCTFSAYQTRTGASPEVSGTANADGSDASLICRRFALPCMAVGRRGCSPFLLRNRPGSRWRRCTCPVRPFRSGSRFRLLIRSLPPLTLSAPC